MFPRLGVNDLTSRQINDFYKKETEYNRFSYQTWLALDTNSTTQEQHPSSSSAFKGPGMASSQYLADYGSSGGGGGLVEEGGGGFDSRSGLNQFFFCSFFDKRYCFV